ncbi:MAG: carbohydrate binding family 9 domain-containing protein, partial [Syntrophothermus sp.]
MKKFFTLLFLLNMAVRAFPPEQPKFISQIQAVKSSEKITVDGVLNESVWQKPGITKLIQQEPVQGTAPSQKSEVWLAYDDEALYFAARYYDSNPDLILARLVRRDFIWGDPSDGCVLYLDPYGDKRNGYFFYVSAAGALADGLIENDVKQPNDLTWDAVWEGKSKIDNNGWTIEMKIPFSQLRFKDTPNQ